MFMLSWSPKENYRWFEFGFDVGNYGYDFCLIPSCWHEPIDDLKHLSKEFCILSYFILFVLFLFKTQTVNAAGQGWSICKDDIKLFLCLGCCWCGCQAMGLSKRVSSWTVQEVLEWMKEQYPDQMGTLHKAIMKHDISGATHVFGSTCFYWHTCSSCGASLKRVFKFALFFWFTLDTHCACEWICRPCVAEIKGLSPGASRGGSWGAAAGNLAGPPPPQSSGGNRWTQRHLLWWECQTTLSSSGWSWDTN